MNEFPAARLILHAVFGAAVVITLAGALLAVSTVRIIRSVCGLALCCVGLAGIYYFLHSPFLALMQILIYVGAVCITIIFAVMLAEPDEPEEPAAERPSRVWTVLSLAGGVALAWAVAALGLGGSWTVPTAPLANDGSLKAIGIALLTTYSVAFETMSLVLLVAILGALAVAHGGRRRE